MKSCELISRRGWRRRGRRGWPAFKGTDAEWGWDYLEDVGSGLLGVLCEDLDVLVVEGEGSDAVVVDVEFLAESGERDVLSVQETALKYCGPPKKCLKA